MTTAYHPEADGQTERVNQILEQYLRIYCSHRQDDWVRLLPTAEFAYNNAPSESTCLSPFYAEYGYNPRMAPDIPNPLNHPSLQTIFAARAEAQDQAKAALTLAAERMKWYFDQHRQEVHFKVGDQVLIKAADLCIPTKTPTPKLAPRNYGPFTITHQLGPVTFKLQLPRQYRVHPVYHASKLIPYHTDTIAQCNPSKPDPITVEGNDEYEVETVLDSRIHYGYVQYLVKWKGYPDSKNSWEPVRNLCNCKESIDNFHKAHPDAVQPCSLTDARPLSVLFDREIWNGRFAGAPPSDGGNVTVLCDKSP